MVFCLPCCAESNKMDVLSNHNQFLCADYKYWPPWPLFMITPSNGMLSQLPTGGMCGSGTCVYIPQKCIKGPIHLNSGSLFLWSLVAAYLLLPHSARHLLSAQPNLLMYFLVELFCSQNRVAGLSDSLMSISTHADLKLFICQPADVLPSLTL